MLKQCEITLYIIMISEYLLAGVCSASASFLLLLAWKYTSLHGMWNLCTNAVHVPLLASVLTYYRTIKSRHMDKHPLKHGHTSSANFVLTSSYQSLVSCFMWMNTLKNSLFACMCMSAVTAISLHKGKLSLQHTEHLVCRVKKWNWQKFL